MPDTQDGAEVTSTGPADALPLDQPILGDPEHGEPDELGLFPPSAPGGRTAPDVFTRFALDYLAQHADRTVTVLQAGCATAGPELDLAALAADHDVAVSQVEEDGPATRSALAGRPELDSAVLGELRTVPITPRSFDIVQCSMLLDRISNADMVLSRLVGALRPGGLLFLRTADRETAAGFLDRRAPAFLRNFAWREIRPGEAGPFPAIYEPIASARGIQAFLTRHGLSVAHREFRNGLTDSGGPAGLVAARNLVAWLSRGRLATGYDELCYVIRKPEDRFARVLSS
ncbi:MAG TPA: methyltransferase domain-containing protein [Streptosporangiaceae bacterium]|jgi:SAM-dependent methyltransferase